MRVNAAVVATLGPLLLSFPPSMRTPHRTAPKDACALLTQAEVSAALGVSVGAGTRLVATSPNLCGWSEPGKGEVSAKRVVTAIETIQSFGYEKVPVPSGNGITKEPLKGVGDDAIYITTAGIGTGLSVRKGDFAFKVRVYGFPVDQVKAKEKALALKVLARL